MLFISHANPQDNAAASWFATQLTLLGYEVWCDLKNTRAGESNFWLKVQKKIENEAAKFIFILSNNSRDFEKKLGVYKEVQTADNLKRDNFILPLRIEKLTGSVPILISPDLSIPSENWAQGLRELERRLIEDGVPMRHLIQLDEPLLRFGHGQALAHPKDGLTLFGPYTRTAGSVRYGVIGTQAGIEFFNRWAANINRHLPAYEGSKFRRKKNAEYGKLAHQFFPGFETTFGIMWNHGPECRCVIPDGPLAEALKVHELHTRIARVVKLYSKRLIKANYESENKPELWFVVVSQELENLCRPHSDPPKEYTEGTREEDFLEPQLFADADDADSFAEEYQDALKFKPDFHNQLKARLLKHQIITQLLQQETLEACGRAQDNLMRDKEDPATIEWNLATSIFYKTRRKPWILADARLGVCYVGIVFKRLNKARGNKNACCGAQMFLEDGNGMVFKGALGPWYSESLRECHLDKAEARKLLACAIKSYADEHQQQPPREIFIHGSARFTGDEWAGFEEAAQETETRVVGIRIRRVFGGLRLFTRGQGAVMRCAALIHSDKKAFLFTAGFVPRLNTYPGWNVPNPLDVEICTGEADIKMVLQDILRLSKLNYNSCKFADGYPITLKFAGKVGDILTTLPPEDGESLEGDIEDYTPLPFWHYI